MKLFNYIVIILIIVYIARLGSIYPSFVDELIALVILFYFIAVRSAKPSQLPKKTWHYSSRQRHTYFNQEETGKAKEPLTLNEAYRILGILPDGKASVEDVKRAYKEKISRNHPDKVSHLSEELQEKAKELTILINQAYNLIMNSLKTR
jgi:hypothetical protein